MTKITINILLFSILMTQSIPSFATNNNTLLMPYPSGQIWANDKIYANNTNDRMHTVYWTPPKTSDNRIIAPISATVSIICKDNNLSKLRLISSNQDIYLLGNIETSSLYIKEGEEVLINQGEYLGQAGKKGDNNSKCNNNITLPSLSFSWDKNKCIITIDSNQLDCKQSSTTTSDTASTITSTNVEKSVITNCQQILESSWMIGDKGLLIIRLQQCLREKGLYNYLQGLTGYLGNYTASVLNKLNKKDNQSIPITPCQTILGDHYTQGQKSEKVKRLQECLRETGLYNYAGGVTGYFGEVTLLSYTNWLNSSNDICRIIQQSQYINGETSLRVKRLQQCLVRAKLLESKDINSYFNTLTMTQLKTWRLR
jgi:hypothetical protein